MNMIIKNILVFLFVIFLFVALGQWNHPRFQQKAYDKAKELIIIDLTEKEEKAGRFVEPPEYSADLIQVEVVTEDDAIRYLYDIDIKNPTLIQLSALNLVFSPKVEIAGFIKSQP